MRKNQKFCFYLFVGVFLTSVLVTAIFENINFVDSGRTTNYLHSSSGSANETYINKLWAYDFNEYINSIEFSEDGEFAVAGIGNHIYWGNVTDLFEGLNLDVIKKFSASYEVESVAITANGSYIVAGSADHNLYVFNSSNETPLWSKNLNDNDVLAVDISSDGKYIAAGSSNCLYLFDINSTELWHFNGTGNGVNNDIDILEISADGYYIAAGAVYDILLFNRTSSIPMWNHDNNWNGNFHSLAISADGKYTVAGNWDNYVYLFNNTNTNNPMLWSSPTYDYVYSVDISSDGCKIVAAGKDKYVYFFNNWSYIPDWRFDTNSVIYEVAISSDGNYVTAGSSTNLYLFNASTIEPKWTIPISGQLNALAISYNGTYVAAGTLDGIFYLIGHEYIYSSSGASPPDLVIIIVIIIIVGSVITVSVPSTYTIVSKHKEKINLQKKALSKLKHKPKKVGTRYSYKDIIGDKTEEPKTKPINASALTPIPMPTTETRFKKKKKTKKPKTEEKSEDKAKTLEEIKKTWSEIDIQEKMDLCLVHKGRIKGLNYICPKCQAKYCLKCATHLAKKEKRCWACNEPISIGIENDNIGIDLQKEQGKDYLKIFNDENGLEKLKNLENINITAVSSEFLNEIDKFNWDDEDREEFIKEMGSLSPKLRKEFLEDIKKNSEIRDITE